MAVLQGVGYALSLCPLPFIFFDAVAETEERARDMQFDANAERQLEKAMRAVRGGRFGSF